MNLKEEMHWISTLTLWNWKQLIGRHIVKWNNDTSDFTVTACKIINFKQIQNKDYFVVEGKDAKGILPLEEAKDCYKLIGKVPEMPERLKKWGSGYARKRAICLPLNGNPESGGYVVTLERGDPTADDTVFIRDSEGKLHESSYGIFHYSLLEPLKCNSLPPVDISLLKGRWVYLLNTVELALSYKDERYAKIEGTHRNVVSCDIKMSDGCSQSIDLSYIALMPEGWEPEKPPVPQEVSDAQLMEDVDSLEPIKEWSDDLIGKEVVSSTGAQTWFHCKDIALVEEKGGIKKKSVKEVCNVKMTPTGPTCPCSQLFKDKIPCQICKYEPFSEYKDITAQVFGEKDEKESLIVTASKESLIVTASTGDMNCYINGVEITDPLTKLYRTNPTFRSTCDQIAAQFGKAVEEIKHAFSCLFKPYENLLQDWGNKVEEICEKLNRFEITHSCIFQFIDENGNPGDIVEIPPPESSGWLSEVVYDKWTKRRKGQRFPLIHLAEKNSFYALFPSFEVGGTDDDYNIHVTHEPAKMLHYEYADKIDDEEPRLLSLMKYYRIKPVPPKAFPASGYARLLPEPLSGFWVDNHEVVYTKKHQSSTEYPGASKRPPEKKWSGVWLEGHAPKR